MKYFFTILFVSILTGLGTGYYIKPEDPQTGDLIIGLSISALFFVLMPVFIYHRWKNKDIKNYMLTKENIEKMQDHNKEKKL